MARDSYEVYYYQNSRWSVHASYEADAREESVAEAMNVEAKFGYPCRVIKETFFPETNTSEEVVVWQSAKAKKMADSDNMFGNKQQAAPAKPAAKKSPPPPPPPKRDEKKPKRPPPSPIKKSTGKAKKKKTKKGFFGKLLTSISISAAVAIGSAAFTVLLILYLQDQSYIAPENRTPIIFGTFVTVFFVTLLYSLNREFSLLGTALKSEAAPARASSAMQSPMMRAAAAPPTQDAEFDQVEIERGQEIDEEFETETAEDEDAELPAELDADMTETTEPEASQPASEPEPEPQPEPVRAEPQPAPQAVSKPEPKAEKKPPEQSPNDDEARQLFAGFVNQANATVAKELGELNAFSRFGMSLLLAGAVSSLGQSKRLGREPQLAVLKQGLSGIGNTPDRTQTFCAELPGYGKNPRYTGMIQSGSKSMTAYLKGDSNATNGMGAMLADWSKPEKRPSVPSVFTFLFTDIAGSTAMTQQLGNAGAQKVVRAHNTAVRGAIAKVKGREVKHTGDGIMAVFSDAASAVNASIQMQRDIAAHNKANPSLPLVVRIGINAGEAVEEENDFFGAAVQMTARTCSKATDGNIWVTQSVVDGCKGQRLGFIPRGKFEMKGIQGARPLYEVGWTEKHKNELADL